MNLEDHIGDIIRKARAMSGVAASAAASAAQISETQLSDLEETGETGAKINFSELGKILALHPNKLEAIANGWLPTQKDLSQWREIRVFSSSGEGLTVNCYLVWDEVTRDAALFDTGLDAKPILDCIAAEQLQLRRTGTTSRRCRKSARPGRRPGCIPVRKTRRWTSATRTTRSFISVVCALRIARRRAMRRMV
jgi:hypothetical protein